MLRGDWSASLCARPTWCDVTEILAAAPQTLTGPEFRDLYGELPDKQTRDNVGDVPYPVRAATRHGVEEPQRVRAFADRIGGHGRPLGAAMMHVRLLLCCSPGLWPGLRPIMMNVRLLCRGPGPRAVRSRRAGTLMYIVCCNQAAAVAGSGHGIDTVLADIGAHHVGVPRELLPLRPRVCRGGHRA